MTDAINWLKALFCHLFHSSWIITQNKNGEVDCRCAICSQEGDQC
ncbi:hypothetical protein [Thalassospira lohafexi]|nr:hypothetical protein [Thalassospira lohafexi]